MVTRAFKNATNFEERKTTKPLIINGDMAVAQRSTSTASITSGNTYGIDRQVLTISGLGTWTMSQESDAPTGQGFSKSLKLDCTTAQASPTGSNNLRLNYRLEGQDLQVLKKGTSSAESVTISFWVKSAKTGTYILELFDGDNSRQISQAYTISSANTWEKKVLSFAGDTTGALDNDNELSLYLFFWLGAGSNFTSGTLNTSWASSTNANRAVGQVNLADSTSNEWYITGVQLEVGEYNSDTIPPFQHESFGDNLVRCQRYYQHTYDYGTSAGANTAVGFVGCNASGTGIGRVLHGLPIRPSMRAIPTITVYSTDGTSGTARRGDAGTNVAVGTGNASRNAFHIENSAGVTDGEQIQFQYRLASEL